MKIQLINTSSDNYSDLQHFIAKHNLFFNSKPWIENYEPDSIFHCVILNNNNEVIGCFNYYRFKKGSFQFLITPPYAPNIELFYINPAESVVGKNSFTKELLNEVISYFEALGVSYINLNLPYSAIDTQPFIWRGYVSKTRYSYLIDLSISQEQLWDNLASEKRKSINKAQKDGLIIKETTDYELVYSLIIQSLERTNKAKNLSILKNILFKFSDTQNTFAFVAYNNNVPIGATFCIVKQKSAVYLFGGFDSENKHHGAGVSCMWSSILKAKELNLEYFDFEGSMNITIERYFREFGGELTPYFCVEKIKPLLNLLLNLKGHKPI